MTGIVMVLASFAMVIHLDSLVLLNFAIVKIDGDALIEKYDVLNGRLFCRLM